VWDGEESGLELVEGDEGGVFWTSEVERGEVAKREVEGADGDSVECDGG
jgi:hypothetical protein